MSEIPLEDVRVLLVSGSRFYPCARLHIVQAVLAPYLAGITRKNKDFYVLRHGACSPTWENGRIVSGLDYLADKVWTDAGGVVDPMPADWKRFGNSAGPRRNRAMVEKDPRPFETIGFPWFMGNARSSGTMGCLDLSDRAGIPTWRIRVDGTKIPYERPNSVPAMREPGKGMHDQRTV